MPLSWMVCSRPPRLQYLLDLFTNHDSIIHDQHSHFRASVNSELRQFRCRLAQQMVESGKHDRCTVPSSGEQDLYSRILISIHPPRLLFFPRLTQPFPMSHYPRKVGRTSDRPIRKDCLKPKTSMRLALSLDNSPTLCSSHRLPG